MKGNLIDEVNEKRLDRAVSKVATNIDEEAFLRKCLKEWNFV